MTDKPTRDADRYRDQVQAWHDEQQRLTARPWWRKASDAMRDFAARHNVALYATAISVGVVLAMTVVLWVTR